MFRESRLLLLNKIDLAPYVSFDVAKARREPLEINPKLDIIEISCTTGAGLDRWVSWIDAFVDIGEETVMCLGIPMLIVERSGNDAVVESGGVRKSMRLDLHRRRAAIGDYVLIHAGYAIEKLDTAEALETLELIRQVYRAGRGEDVS